MTQKYIYLVFVFVDGKPEFDVDGNPNAMPFDSFYNAQGYIEYRELNYPSSGFTYKIKERHIIDTDYRPSENEDDKP